MAKAITMMMMAMMMVSTLMRHLNKRAGGAVRLNPGK
jgi:hypothetical protein